MGFAFPHWMLNLPPWVLCITAVGISAVVWAIANASLAFFINRLASFGWTTKLRLFLRRVRPSLAIIIGTLSFLPMIPATGFSSEVQVGLVRACLVVITLALGIASWRMSQLAFDIYTRKHGGLDFSEDVQIRRRQTRLNLLRQLTTVCIALTTVAVVFMSLPALRTVGVSLFASAGVAGIAIGLAARPAISSLLAGIQIAFTEPIRIGDQVVLEGEWGTVEDITATYVVVNIWDLRRMIVPLSYFLEKPFQNWTRENPQILGTAMLFVDYSVPVEEMREQLRLILKGCKLWDGRAMALQVTDLRENTVEVRALMSAKNAPNAFDLRCHVREKMIEWLRAEYPHALPRTRFAIDSTLLEVPGIGVHNGGAFAQVRAQ
ncbi:mechanosensitive ion channel family protein [Flaviflagellibacter deserti]|uniref:Mechanosensitive ion channel family protein n=1 Tax=Flaviflagellibacter deserti TaxID=2267266 RepID=A0ABV9Z2N3_9HYPH